MRIKYKCDFDISASEIETMVDCVFDVINRLGLTPAKEAPFGDAPFVINQPPEPSATDVPF